MEITKERRGNVVELKASGRLDEHWSSHVASTVNETIREGARRIWFNMSNVAYLSSAGIAVLVGFYKQLAEIDGSFVVTEPSPVVLKILEMTRLSPLLLRAEGDTGPISVERAGRALARENVTFQITDAHGRGGFNCTTIGDPAMLQSGGYNARHAQLVTFGRDRFGLGLGAFGANFEDCRGRYGEFLAIAGAAAYLPTDGSNVPDYIVETGSLLPEVNVLNAIVCEGVFASVARFEASDRFTSLSEVVEAALDIADADEVAVAMVAETNGLIGAALRRSPAVADPEPLARFNHPEIRKWISFTAEPAYTGSLCIIAGVAARGTSSRMQSMLRPMSKRTNVSGHFHAAACRYRPLKKKETDLAATVKPLMEAQSLQGVIHLLPDFRQSGVGESSFIRGACWIGPIRGSTEAA